MNRITQWIPYFALVVGFAALFNSCGSDSQDSQDSKVNPPAPRTEPRPPLANPPVSQPGQPSSSDSGIDQNSTGKSGSVPSVPAGSLMDQIRAGQHTELTEAAMSELFKKEAEACRGGFGKANSDRLAIIQKTAHDLEISYRARHAFLNPVSSCRRRLGLELALGSYMQLRDLIALENCSRRQAAYDVKDTARRNANFHALMEENLTLNCGLSTIDLTDAVARELTTGFVKGWQSVK